MNLPKPGPSYDPQNEARARALLQDADKQNLKRGQDIELVGTRIIGRSPNGDQWVLGVEDDGSPVWSPLA